MTVTFQIGDREFGGAGNLDVDFWVSRIFSLGEVEEGSNRQSCGYRFKIRPAY